MGAGCGGGGLADTAPGIPAIGVDASAGMIALARRAYPELRFQQGTMTALELPADAPGASSPDTPRRPRARWPPLPRRTPAPGPPEPPGPPGPRVPRPAGAQPTGSAGGAGHPVRTRRGSANPATVEAC
ncbi:class I SAM-dependent methyltransferase [Kitasatospora xanthocidica]|uniref:class I SAM-dependent methyltransferase n=1 Tax=Kitasatospora xanthocidica TaxID=83382 RepID=UPI0036E946F6